MYFNTFDVFGFQKLLVCLIAKSLGIKPEMANSTVKGPLISKQKIYTV